MQSTLGFNEADLLELKATGKRQWLFTQRSKPSNLLSPYLKNLQRLQATEPADYFAHPYNARKPAENVVTRNLNTAWLRAVLQGDDALRQKTAWALSQILVVANDTSARTIAAAAYYDLLLENAFSHYGDLLEAVTWHPMMGRYLSYLGNEKADPQRNEFPDENFAREVMQLFTIGLWQLNPDGTLQLDDSGERIPTYTIADIETGARVFTGFKLAGAKGKGHFNRFLSPMRLVDKRHDKGAKEFFNGKLKLPAGMSAAEEIRTFLQALADHPNTAPFISRRLIQQMVSSNPSPGYVSRVSGRWVETNGHLGEVVSAILLDPEAQVRGAGFGKLRDPIGRLVQVIKALGCYKPSELAFDAYPGLQWWRADLMQKVGQEPMKADSVFSFFEPDYSKPGAMQSAGIVGPEFQILDEVTSVQFVNYLWDSLRRAFHTGRGTQNKDSVVCDLPRLSKQIEIYEFLDHLNLMLAAGRISTESLAEVGSLVQAAKKESERAALAVTLIASSPESAILK